MTDHLERVFYEGIDGRFHVGMLDDAGELTVTEGHPAAEGREVFHELPNDVDGEDLCPECHG